MAVPTARDGGSAARERLLCATVDVVATLGYEAARPDHIVRTAGLSRTAFYRHFGGKHGAVLAAARQVLDGLARAVHAAVTGVGAQREPVRSARQKTASDARERAAGGLTALVDALVADPPAAAVLFLEAPAAGPAAQPLRAELLSLLAWALEGDDDDDPAAGVPEPSGLASSANELRAMRAGALHEILHRRLARGQVAALPQVVPALLDALRPGAG